MQKDSEALHERLPQFGAGIRSLATLLLSPSDGGPRCCARADDNSGRESRLGANDSSTGRERPQRPACRRALAEASGTGLGDGVAICAAAVPRARKSKASSKPADKVVVRVALDVIRALSATKLSLAKSVARGSRPPRRLRLTIARKPIAAPGSS